MPWHAPGSLFSQCERIWELLSWDNIWRNVFSKYLFKFYFQSQGEWVATWVGKERRTRKVKSLPETGKLKDPVNYFGSDVTHMRPDPWQVQADFNEESLFCQLRIRPDHKHRGRGGPSLALAVDTQPARFGHPLGCPRGVCPVPLFLKKKKFSFFFSSVDKYHFDSPKDWGLFICHRSTAEVEVFLTLPCRKAAAPTLFQHGYLRLERAGVRTPVCCTCHGPQPACLGFLHRTRPPTRW